MPNAGFPWLTTLIVVPLLGAALVWLLPAGARRHARTIGVAVSLLVLVLAVLATVQFDTADAGTHQLREQVSWIPAFGVSYALGVDGVGLALVLLSVLLVPLVLLGAWHEHADTGDTRGSADGYPVGGGATDAGSGPAGSERSGGAGGHGTGASPLPGETGGATALGSGGGPRGAAAASALAGDAIRARAATALVDDPTDSPTRPVTVDAGATPGGATALATREGTSHGATAVTSRGTSTVAPGSRIRHYVALVLVLEALMVAVFSARDVFLFYVLFEAMLIPVYFMIGSFGGPQRRYAAVKFLLFSLVGGLIMLAGVIALYLAGPGGPDGFLIDTLVGAELPVLTERLIFLAFFLAFAIKAPMWPVHTWLPDAAEQAPAGTSVLLVGVLDKVGTFGMLTLCLPLFPDASRWAAPVIIVLAVISILYGALLAIGQNDLMRLIAYTSVSHFGFIVLGIFAFSSVSIEGSAFYMVNHGLSTGALFLLAGFLIARGRSARIADYGGLQQVMPVMAGMFLVVGLSALALPGLSTFVSEFLVLVGTFTTNRPAAIVATFGVVLAALYILLTYQRLFTGPVRHGVATMPDMSTRERWVVGPLVAVMLVLGFYPAPALDLVREPAVRTMETLGLTDAVDATTTQDGSDQ